MTLLPVAPRTSRFGALLRDPLVRNSFMLMLTTVLGAGSGFLFWLVAARLYPTAEVGRASSLLSSVALLSYFSLLGFDSALIRLLPASSDRAADAGTAIAVVSLSGVVLTLAFAIVAPWLARDLHFVRGSGGHLLLFVALAAGAAVNLLTDSIFVACRATGPNLLINGGLMSTVKVILPLGLVAFGAFGIFAASGVASTLAALVSIAVIRRRLRIPIRLGIHRDALRAMVHYSLSSYLSSCLNLVPLLALPIIVLHQLGPVRSAVYFVAFQIVNLVNAAAYAIGESLFAEGSHEDRDLRALAARSAGLMLAATGVAAVLLMLLAGPVLKVFGSDYASIGTTTLTLFALSAPAVAFNTWASFLLKITRRLRALTVANAVAVMVTIGVAVAGLPHGLPWAAVAWGGGNLLAGATAAAALRGVLRPSRAGTPEAAR